MISPSRLSQSTDGTAWPLHSGRFLELSNSLFGPRLGRSRSRGRRVGSLSGSPSVSHRMRDALQFDHCLSLQSVLQGRLSVLPRSFGDDLAACAWEQ